MMDDLESFCRAFINSHGITCAETIYQTDKIIEDAYEFIEGICNIIGYEPPTV